MSDAPLPHTVARLDAAALVDAVNRARGTGIRFLGAAENGEVGAGHVELPDGTSAIITRSGAPIEELQRTATVLERAAEAGIPAPRYLEMIDLGAHRAILQQRLPGSPPALITADLVGRMIALMQRCSGLAERGPAQHLEPIDLYLTRNGPGFCLHETLLAYDERTRALLSRIHRAGSTEGTEAAATSPRGIDLVHLDLHPGNILVTGDRITGIVDWDGIGRGDHRFALVTLLFDLVHSRRLRPGRLRAGEEERMLTQVLLPLREVPPASLRRWWAHMSLRLVDWTIRHGHPVPEIDHYIGFAEQGFDLLDAGTALTADSLGV